MNLEADRPHYSLSVKETIAGRKPGAGGLFWGGGVTEGGAKMGTTTCGGPKRLAR